MWQFTENPCIYTYALVRTRGGIQTSDVLRWTTSISPKSAGVHEKRGSFHNCVNALRIAVYSVLQLCITFSSHGCHHILEKIFLIIQKNTALYSFTNWKFVYTHNRNLIVLYLYRNNFFVQLESFLFCSFLLIVFFKQLCFALLYIHDYNVVLLTLIINPTTSIFWLTMFYKDKHGILWQ